MNFKAVIVLTKTIPFLSHHLDDLPAFIDRAAEGNHSGFLYWPPGRAPLYTCTQIAHPAV